MTGLQDILDWLAIFFAGKKIAVLGARGVGKTHLIEFMTTGSIPVTYHQTVAPRKTPSRRFQLKDLDIKIKPIVDIGGAVEARGSWQQQVNDADIIFHLFRADQFMPGVQENKKEISRVLDDAQHIHDWIKEKKKSRTVFLIGTHCDQDPAFRGATHERYGDYVDKFRKLQAIRDLVLHHGGEALHHLIVGSMKSEEDTERLVAEIFRTVGMLG